MLLTEFDEMITKCPQRDQEPVIWIFGVGHLPWHWSALSICFSSLYLRFVIISFICSDLWGAICKVTQSNINSNDWGGDSYLLVYQCQLQI